MSDKPEAMTEAHTPTPWDWEWVSANASGGGHLYLIDGDKRKIAALWGKAGEKDENAKLIVLAVNSHARLVAALEAINRRASAQPLRNWDQAIADLDMCADLARAALKSKE